MESNCAKCQSGQTVSLLLCFHCRSLLCAKCTMQSQGEDCRHLLTAESNRTAYSNGSFSLGFFSPELFLRPGSKIGDNEEVFLEGAFEAVRLKAEQGECLVDRAALRKLIEDRFVKKGKFKKDYLESELFDSPNFTALFMQTERQFGGPIPFQFFSLRLKRPSL